jgi:hypothetical protein
MMFAKEPVAATAFASVGYVGQIGMFLFLMLYDNECASFIDIYFYEYFHLALSFN